MKNNILNVSFNGQIELIQLNVGDIVKYYPKTDQRPQLAYHLGDFEGLLGFQQTGNVFSDKVFPKLKEELYDNLFGRMGLPVYQSVLEKINDKNWIVLNMVTKDSVNTQHVQIGVTLIYGALFLASITVKSQHWEQWKDYFGTVLDSLKFNDEVKS